MIQLEGPQGRALTTAEIVLAMVSRGLTIGTAESVTGGLLCGRLTDVAGASSAVAGAVVSYSNGVKHRVLGVPEHWLEDPGPVSALVAGAMATGVNAALGVDVAVATTGEAGPQSSSGQPVGTVFVALASRGEPPVVRQLALRGTRAEIRTAAVDAALDLLSDWLAGDAPGGGEQAGRSGG